MNVESLIVTDSSSGVFGYAVLLRMNADERPSRADILEHLTEAGVERTAQVTNIAMAALTSRPIRADECYPAVMPGEAHA